MMAVPTSSTGLAEPSAQATVRFGRVYRFSAAHRMHSPAYDDARNRLTYGKCNNPAGHGHNYVVVVAVEGPLDPIKRMVVDLVALDRAVRQVLDALDFKHLDMEVPHFIGPRVSTAENILQYLVAQLSDSIAQIEGFAGRLARVELSETRNNHFEWTA